MSGIPLPSEFKESIKESAQELVAESKPHTPIIKEELTLEQEIDNANGINKPEVKVDKIDNEDQDSDDNNDVSNDELKKDVEPLAGKNNESDKVKETIAADVKPEEFEFEEPEVSEYVKSLYNKNEEAGKPSDSKKTKDTSPEVEAEASEKYKPYVEKATEYESVLKNPIAKAFIDFVKAGGTDPSEFIKQAGIVDVKSLTSEQLLEMDCKQNGLTEDETKIELEAFEDKTPLEKKKIIENLKSEFNRKRDEKLKTFTAANEAQQQVMTQAIKTGRTELDSVLPKMEGKSYKGLLLTPEMVKKVRQSVTESPVPKFDKSGQFVGFDIPESIRRAVILNFDEQRSKSLIEMGRTMGTDKALRLRNRPEKKEVTSPLQPQPVSTLEKATERATEKLWAKQGVKN
jgi:hypothetical protein